MAEGEDDDAAVAEHDDDDADDADEEVEIGQGWSRDDGGIRAADTAMVFCTYQISSDGKESQYAKVAQRSRNPPPVRSADARMDLKRCRAEIRALRKIERE